MHQLQGSQMHWSKEHTMADPHALCVVWTGVSHILMPTSARIMLLECINNVLFGLTIFAHLEYATHHIAISYCTIRHNRDNSRLDNTHGQYDIILYRNDPHIPCKNFSSRCAAPKVGATVMRDQKTSFSLWVFLMCACESKFLAVAMWKALVAWLKMLSAMASCWCEWSFPPLRVNPAGCLSKRLSL